MQRITKVNIVAVQLMERVQIAGIQCGKTAGEIVQEVRHSASRNPIGRRAGLSG